MTGKTELLPCPFCNSSAMPGVDYAQCSNSACPAFHIKTQDLRMWNTRAAPPEDVRAVVDEPVGKVLSDAEMGIGYDRKFGRVIWFGTPDPGLLYRHPQRPMVLPERHEDHCDSSEAEAYQNAWNACLDRIAELNK